MSFSGTESSSLWQASTIPIPDIYIPSTLRTDGSRDYTQAATDCLDVLNEGNFTEHCTDVSSSLKDHFLEACIRDYSAMGGQNATSVMLSALIFYCQGALDVSECSLSGFFDFCKPTEEGPGTGIIWIIIAIIAALLIIIILVICVVIYKKKQKRKRLIDDTMTDIDGFHTLSSKGGYFHPGLESETSFMEGRPGSSWSAGRRSVDSADSRFFESPVMFLGAPPDRFVFREARSPSVAPSGTSSRMSGRSMSIDITVSPTPEPDQIDNRSMNASSALLAMAKRRRASSPGMSTPGDLIQFPSPLNTDVKRPKPPSQDILGNRSIMPPGNKSDHPPPNITPLTSVSNDSSMRPVMLAGAGRRRDNSDPKPAPLPGRNDTLSSPTEDNGSTRPGFLAGAGKRRNSTDPRPGPLPGRNDTLSSPTEGNKHDPRKLSLPTGPKLAPPPGRSGSVDMTTHSSNETRKSSLPSVSGSSFPKLAPPPGHNSSLDQSHRPLGVAPGAPTPHPHIAPNAPHSLRLGAGTGTSSPWKAKPGNPPLPAPSSLTARILRNNASSMGSTPTPSPHDQQHK